MPFRELAREAPRARKQAVTIEQHGVTRVDNYAWMRDDNWQEVLRDPAVLREDIRGHLLAENAYYREATAELEPLRQALFAEMRGRIKEDDSSVPAPDGPYAYALRYREGGEYPVFVRTPREGGSETILFDGDLEAKGEDFFHVVAVDHSPDHELVAYGVDRRGSEYFDIRIRNVATGEEFPETVGSTDGDAVWAADSESFYYVERDANQRPKRIRHHVLGEDPAKDIVVYEEPDDSLFLHVDKSQSGRFIFIGSNNSTTSEYRFLPADAPVGTKPTLIAPRLPDQLYDVEHHGEHFYIQTNADGAVDFKIVRTPVAAPGREHWVDWLPHRQGVYLLSSIPFAERLVRLERHNALPRIVICDYDLANSFEIEFDEAAYDLSLSPGYEYDTDVLRYVYQSPSTPEQTFDFDMRTRKRSLRKTRAIPSGHDPRLYVVERFFVEAADGAAIPVTVLRLRTTRVDGRAPLLLYGYGSYGITIGAWFNSNVLSLVDRGAVYAIAHIRGGAAKGRQWYLDGKFEKKTNSFRDFVCCAEYLQQHGYSRPQGTVIYGGSAGGLLVGATVNLRPDLFAGVIAAVPFVDVLNTVSDETLPLTPPEWAEWGNPVTDPAAFACIAAYSPYENIRSDLRYPPILATGGLADYRVTYWEPAKWIARLREQAQGGPFFLRMNMDAGHAGSAARFEQLRERAQDYAFALELMGLAGATPVRHH